MTREELKNKLIQMENGYVVTWGASAISKDLIAVLQEGEEVLEICGARKSSLLKFFKGGRAVSCYLAITNKRFIYIERGRRDMSLNPFCRKTITVNRSGMQGKLWANEKVEKMLYPYILQIQSGEESYEIAVAKDISQFLQEENKETVQEELPLDKERDYQQFKQDIKENSELENRANDQVEISGNTIRKKKKKLPIIIGCILGTILIIFVVLLIIGAVTSDEDTEKRERNEVSEEVVELNTYDGGFAGWKADGYPGSVRTDITIPYPLGNTEYNNYAVYIGTGKINVGIIMQEDEAPMSEWSWLLEAEPDYDTEAYYFSCTLTYTGQDVGENQLPLFVIDDAESYFVAEVDESSLETEMAIENKNYSHLQEFIELLGTFSDPPELADSEVENYYKKEYDLWQSGEAYNFITIDEAGNLTIEDHSDEFKGEWYDTFSQRCGMKIDSNGVYYYIDINWGSSAYDNTHWAFVGTYDSNINGIVYTGSCVYEHYSDAGEKEETYEYTDGEGIIYIGEDGILYWEDYKENAGYGCSFERVYW